MKNEKLISVDELIDFINSEIDTSQEDKDDAKLRGDERGVAHTSGEIQEALRIKRHLFACKTVDVVHASWVPSYEEFDECVELCIKARNVQTGWECSNCQAYAVDSYNYCPRCGAKMDGGNSL